VKLVFVLIAAKKVTVFVMNFYSLCMFIVCSYLNFKCCCKIWCRLKEFWEGVHKILRRVPQNFGKGSTKFWEGVHKILGRVPQNFGKGSTKFWEGFHKILGRIPQNFGKVSTKFWEGFRKINEALLSTCSIQEFEKH